MKKWNTPEIVALDVKNTNTWFGSWWGNWWGGSTGPSYGSASERSAVYCFGSQVKAIVDS